MCNAARVKQKESVSVSPYDGYTEEKRLLRLLQNNDVTTLSCDSWGGVRFTPVCDDAKRLVQLQPEPKWSGAGV